MPEETIAKQTLTALQATQEQLDHLIERARYYDDYPLTKCLFIEKLEEIQSGVRRAERIAQNDR